MSHQLAVLLGVVASQQRSLHYVTEVTLALLLLYETSTTRLLGYILNRDHFKNATAVTFGL